ncbi:hypothetical protein QCA50_017569 [Cerrena zonata]|uniref:Calponin-homology (CH) domain-containing protein n=1 Tax=Cerrena zonata TaxID=2478898 RepID=A0AAW0FJ36_9APHY
MAKLKETNSGSSAPAPVATGAVGGAGAGANAHAPVPTANTAHKTYLTGKTSGTTHTVNDEERTEFTRHINSVLSGDSDIGDRLPFDTETFQIFDECRDGLVLSKLINDSVPETIDTRVLNLPGVKKKTLNNFQMSENANIVINSAKAIGCVVVNVHSEDIIDDPIEESEKPEIEDFDAEGEREARVFTLWLNSLDVDPPVVSLFEDLKDGLVLLQAFELVLPGSVSFKHINKKPANALELSRFKALENTNYAVEIGKANKFSLVGIEGSDIVDGNKLLTLGLVWQLMRRNIINTLSQLSVGGNQHLSDADILKWANAQVTKGGKSGTVRSFSDSSLSSGIFLLDILNGIKPGYVDYDLVYQGTNLSEDEKYANAKLAISIARKIGALICLKY